MARTGLLHVTATLPLGPLGCLPQLILVAVPPVSQAGLGAKILSVQGGTSFLSVAGTPSNWTLSLMGFTLNIGIMRQLGVRKFVTNSPTNTEPTSTRSVGRTLRVKLSALKV